MNYVESFNLFGIEAKEIPCIKGSGAPTTATAGAVGLLYMNTDNGDMYKCIAVTGSVYTWVALVEVPANLVKTVNGTAPDENGNVQVETGGGCSDTPTLFVDVFNPTLTNWICMEEATATGDVAAFFEAVASNKKVLVIANCDLDGECWTEQHGRLKFYAGAVSVEFSEFIVEIHNAGDIYTTNAL